MREERMRQYASTRFRVCLSVDLLVVLSNGSIGSSKVKLFTENFVKERRTGSSPIMSLFSRSR